MAWKLICNMVIDGEPVPQGRPRFGHGRAYDPPKSRKYKEKVKRVAESEGPESPVTCPVRLTISIYRTPPKSWSRRKKAQAYAGWIRPTTKPDISNVLKGIEDALTGVWYEDDSQIVEYGTIGKWYAEEPRVYVQMEVEE